MKILSGANQAEDIVSKEYVDGQINNHMHDADEIPCESKTLKLGSKEYKISENLQNALENLLDYVYMNASGVLDLQTNLKSVSDTVSKIPSYKGGTGISVAGDTIGHSNNILPGMVGTGEILTPDFGDTVYTTWFSYDAQGHVTQSGTGGFVMPTVQTDDSLSDTSTKPLQNKTVKAKFDAVDSQISSLGIDNNNQWTKINSKADADHTHNYAGSSTVGGSAITANALTSKNIGSDTQPVYFNSTGTPSPIKYTLGNASEKTIKTATAVSSAAWVNLATGQKYIPDMAFLSYWNGAVNDQGNSNLKYCNKGAFGTAATKGVDTDVTSGSANLITSGGVSTALANKVSTTSNTIVPTWWCGSNNANSSGYYHFLTVTMSQYADFNATLLITNEFSSVYVGIFNIHIRCDDGTTPIVPNYMSWLVRRGWVANAIIAVVSKLTVKFYIKQDVSQYGGICFKALSVSSRQGNGANYTNCKWYYPIYGINCNC